MTERPPYLVERSQGYLEYRLPICVKLVVDHHGRVPLLRNERDEWELPGGKPEAGETPEELVYSAEHKELRVFTYDEVADLRKPAPYKRIIGRWRNRLCARR
jgi:8-oxo-dGTP pyrophosphatase MutT (NUDIX family)